MMERTESINRYFSDVLANGATIDPGRSGLGDVPDMSSVLDDNELLYRQPLSSDILGYYSEISDEFARRRLRYFFMKSFRSYDYADNDMDIVLVDRPRKDEYLRALGELGFEFLWNRSVLREPYKRFFVKKDAGGKERLPIVHVHYAVSWNGMKFLDAEKVWGRLRESDVFGKTVMTPSPEDEILIMAAHSVHENGYVTVGELLHLRNLLEGAGGLDTGYITRSAAEGNWRKALKVFLSFAESCSAELTGERLIPGYFAEAVGGLKDIRPVPAGKVAPYFFPREALLASYSDKVLRDIVSGRLTALPRELFTFGFIMWLFRHKKKTKFDRHLGI